MNGLLRGAAGMRRNGHEESRPPKDSMRALRSKQPVRIVRRPEEETTTSAPGWLVAIPGHLGDFQHRAHKQTLVIDRADQDRGCRLDRTGRRLQQMLHSNWSSIRSRTIRRPPRRGGPDDSAADRRTRRSRPLPAHRLPRHPLAMALVLHHAHHGLALWRSCTRRLLTLFALPRVPPSSIDLLVHHPTCRFGPRSDRAAAAGDLDGARSRAPAGAHQFLDVIPERALPIVRLPAAAADAPARHRQPQSCSTLIYSLPPLDQIASHGPAEPAATTLEDNRLDRSGAPLGNRAAQGRLDPQSDEIINQINPAPITRPCQWPRIARHTTPARPSSVVRALNSCA